MVDRFFMQFIDEQSGVLEHVNLAFIEYIDFPFKDRTPVLTIHMVSGREFTFGDRDKIDRIIEAFEEYRVSL